MRFAFLVAAALTLSGCAHTDFFGDSSSAPAQEATASPTPIQSAPAPASERIAAEQPPPPVAPSSQPPEAAEQMPVASSAQTMYAPAAQVSADVSARCRNLAKQRSGDAAFQGEDSDTQTSVFQRTYNDCIDWDVRHRS